MNKLATPYHAQTAEKKLGAELNYDEHRNRSSQTSFEQTTNKLEENHRGYSYVTYSDEVLRLTREHWHAMGNHLLGPEPEKGMLDMLNEQRSLEALKMVVDNVPFALEGRRLLEIGCGVGMTQLVARRKGIEAFGIEPGPGVEVAKCLLAENGYDPTPVTSGVGEKVPFPDDFFDVVCSFQVLEHVQNPASVLSETARVLKPGGYFVHVFPSYGSFWEGHYGVPWIPHLPKALGRVYIRLLRRDLSMLQELQLLTHGKVARILKKQKNVRVIGWGIDLWERCMRTLEFSEWGQLDKLKRWVLILHRLGLVNFVVALGRMLHFQTPIVLTGTKLPVMSRLDLQKKTATWTTSHS